MLGGWVGGDEQPVASEDAPAAPVAENTVTEPGKNGGGAEGEDQPGELAADLFPDSFDPPWYERHLLELERMLALLFGAELDRGPRIVEEAAFALPPAAELSRPEEAHLARALSIPVSGFAFEGNTAFSDEQLAEVVAPFLTKGSLTTDDLQSARLALTEHYIRGGEETEDEAQVGYVNSGVLLPDQDPSANGGEVTFKIVEGIEFPGFKILK